MASSPSGLRAPVGSTVPVRVHSYLDGASITIPPSTGTAVAAGVALATIQRFGLMLGTRPSGSPRWWTVAPMTILGRLYDAGMLKQEQAEVAQAALQGADAVIGAGEELAGGWVCTHCDHKPENSLLADGQVAVLDWDESGHCRPRLKAVESALRWAGAGHGEPRRDVFRTTLRSVTGTHFTDHGATMVGSPASPMPGRAARGAGHVNRVTVKL